MSDAKDSFADFENHIEEKWRHTLVQAVTPGCEISTYNPKTKKGGVGIVTKIHKNKNKVLAVCPYTRRVYIVPLTQIVCVTKTPKDTHLAYS